MLSTSIFLLLAALFSTLILAYTSLHATQTPISNANAGLLQGWMPLPTSPPLLTHDHLRRQDDDLVTCGFTDGNSNSPNVCSTSQACSFGSAPNYYFGCCATTSGTFGDDCYAVGVCVPWTSAEELSFTNQGASIYSDSVICGSAAPNCATTYIDGVPTFTGPHTHYDCVSGTGGVYRLSQDPTTKAVTTQVQVSVVQVTVISTPTSTTVSSTSAISLTSSSSASAATTTSGAEGAVYRAHAGLAGLAVVARFFGMG